LRLSDRFEVLNRFGRTLFGRTLLFMTLVVVSGACLLVLIARHYAGVAAQEAYDRLLAGAVVQVAENLYVQGGVLALNPPLGAFVTMSDYDPVYYRVLDTRGVTVAGYRDLRPNARLDAARQGVVFEYGTYEGQRVRIATIARQMPDAAVPGWALVTVAQTVHAREQLAGAMTLKVTLLIGVLSILAIAASGFAIKRGLRPLTAIEQSIAARDPSELKPLHVDTPSEMAAVIGAINLLMERLAKRITMMQRFIADAAHQIRTPLASLDAQIELLSAEPDEAARAKRLAALQASCADVGRLAGQLLNHAMVMHRSEALALQRVELAALVRETLGRAIPLAGEKDVSVTFSSEPAEVEIEGDPVSLREAVSNVLHNALTHGNADAIDVALRGAPQAVTLTITDNGPGIAPASWQAVLEPFVKLDSQRPGSGLGLAIVHEVMRAHSGQVGFAFGDAGFSVVLTFPRASASANRADAAPLPTPRS
jgi:two-component system sensor histidine kinase TctE